MRCLLALSALIHGVCHLPGFASSWQLLALPGLPYRTSLFGGRLDLGDGGIRAWGVMWLALAVAFGVYAIGVWTRASWWLRVTPILVAVSTLCCLAALPEALLGLAANLVLLVLACSAIRFPGPLIALKHSGLDELWEAASTGSGARFDPEAIPEAGRTYLKHTIASGTPLAASVRLRMHGEIKIGKWHPFHAEQVIVPERGMIWAATASMFGVPVCGADQVLDAKGGMDWNIFDTVPVVHAEGPDISRSGAGVCWPK